MFFQTTTTRFKKTRNARQDNEFSRFTFKVLGIPVFTRTTFLRILRKVDNVGRRL